MPLSESMEDYLEAIFEIGKRKRVVRVKDVAGKLGVTMPSVNGALKNLEAKGLITHQKYEYIELTETGFSEASKISDNHQTIYNFLKDILGVDSETAVQDACKIEHDLSTDALEKLSNFIKNQSRIKH